MAEDKPVKKDENQHASHWTIKNILVYIVLPIVVVVSFVFWVFPDLLPTTPPDNLERPACESIGSDNLTQTLGTHKNTAEEVEAKFNDLGSLFARKKTQQGDIVEKIKLGTKAKYLGRSYIFIGRPRWSWSLFVNTDTSSKILNSIRSVTYILHHSYANPIQAGSKAESYGKEAFESEIFKSYGTFDIDVLINLKNDEVRIIPYRLEL